MLIDLDGDMTPIDNEVIRSKVKVRRITVVLLRTVCHRAFIFHMIIGPGECLTPIDFVYFGGRVKVTRVTFVKKGFSSVF